MKAILPFFIGALFLLSSCSIESPQVDVDYIDVYESSDFVSGFRIVNSKIVYYEDWYNDYDFEISITNTGDYRAYDVLVDINIFLSDGSHITHSRPIGNLDAGESHTIYHLESLVNLEIDDYFVDTYWNE